MVAVVFKGAVDRPAEAVIGREIKGIAVPLLFWDFRMVDIEDGVVETSDFMDDRDGAVAEGDHLGESAGLKERRNENAVCGSVGKVGKLFIKEEVEMDMRVILILFC